MKHTTLITDHHDEENTDSQSSTVVPPDNYNVLLVLPRDVLDVITSLLDEPTQVSLSRVARHFKPETKLPSKKASGYSFSESFCCKCAEQGYLALLKWARENGCGWDLMTCAKAAEGGHLEVLQWARENGCEWDGNNMLFCS